MTRQQRRQAARARAWQRLRSPDWRPVRDPVGGGFLLRRERRELMREAGKAKVG